jgi:hypothetical protein
MTNTPNRMAKPSGRDIALTGLFAGMFATTIGLAKCAPNTNNGSLGMPSLDVPERQVADLDHERKTFFGRVNAILEALELGNEERVQILTAEKIAKCIEMRTEANTTCEVIQRYSYARDDGYFHRGKPGFIVDYIDHEGWLYNPAEVYCTSYTDQSSPQAIVATYIGPVCNSYDENGEFCNDSQYASMLAFDRVAARYKKRGKAEQAGRFIMSFSGTFHDSFEWDSGKHASTAYPGHNHSFESVTVLQTDSTLAPLLDDYSYICDDAVEALDFPTPEGLIASENYSNHIDAIDILWDTFDPVDILTPPDWDFITNFEKEGYHFVPLLIDENLAIDVKVSTSTEEEGEFIFETSGYTNPSILPVEKCRMSVTGTELSEEPSLVEDLIDCELVGGGDSFYLLEKFNNSFH